MIKYIESTIFNTDAEALVNTVNCVGVMGAGIALEFKLRYPEMFAQYKADYDKGIYKVVKVRYFDCGDGKIINFPTKWHFKYPSKLRYIEEGLQNFCNTYRNNGIKKVAFPKLGSNNGGLDWNEVKALMEKYLEPIDAEVYVCLDTLGKAQGVEKEMLEMFNSATEAELKQIVRLTQHQIVNINENKPYKRFWMIRETKTIGEKTYSKLFDYFYRSSINCESIEEQLHF